MVTADQIVATHRENPTWHAGQIARHLGCDPVQVRVVKARRGLNIPRKPLAHQRRHKTPEQTSITQLGRACRAAGITLNDVKQIAAGRLENV